jgi:hypothetical protein
MERKRTLLMSLFQKLEGSYRRAIREYGAAAVRLNEYDDEPYDFDDLDNDIVETCTEESNLSGNPSESVDESDKHLTPETRPLAMPSTCLPNGHPFSHIELKLRKLQANRYIMALREVIAEKSFQFTHVIRQAPRKAVITRARNVVLKINYKISFYSRMYGRCRAALVRLAADPGTLNVFRILTRQDVKASSAVINPNTPGSTSVSLSWIWQITASGETSPASLLECTRFITSNDIFPID